MERRKLTKEDLDKVRHIEGFPIGKDEDIIALSDAPYYTACPNPFIEEFIRENGTPYDEETDDYHREPFAADVSEGKNDPFYTAHTYHTKAPYKAIMRYIKHYTSPHDIVLDGFCGTGMTGVAAQMCGLNESLFEENTGARYAVLTDLAPAATFIASNYNHSFDTQRLQSTINSIIADFEREYGWLYETRVKTGSNSWKTAKINYTVWSDVFICPNCGNDVVFWTNAVDREGKTLHEEFCCPQCGAKLTKRSCELSQESVIDSELGEVIVRSKKVPVMIVCTTQDGRRIEKEPDSDDLETIAKASTLKCAHSLPIDRMCEGSESRRNDKFGIKHVHQFFTERNRFTLAYIYDRLDSNELRFAFTASVMRATVLNKVHIHNFLFGGGGWNAGYLTGVLYLPSLSVETAVTELLKDRAKTLSNVMANSLKKENVVVSTQSSTDYSNIPENSIDYIFVDPPFGDNLNYSELSFIWEAWLRVFTNNNQEAIVSKAQRKNIADYQTLMANCFAQFYRVLKPNRWMTIEFHNSKNAVWNSIQEGLIRSGFIVADVRTLDKQTGSFKQVNSTSAVKQDLVISAYKPKESFRKSFIENAGRAETAWAFVQQHLDNLPIVVDANKDGKIDILAERQAFLLFDRMVAYHIMQGIPVPMDASDFYRGLDERFLKRDGMYFLPEQVNEYDAARIENDLEDVQLSFIVSNEKTAISWLYAQLETPQTYAELQPKFMQEVRSIDKFEALPELAVLLEENFLQGDDGKWYIPDITKEADMAKLREKSLLKEFDGYLATKGKLKLFRSEAIRAGFAKLWKDKNYKLIVDTAERLPEQVIQEDDKLLMYYDISLGRV